MIEQLENPQVRVFHVRQPLHDEFFDGGACMVAGESSPVYAAIIRMRGVESVMVGRWRAIVRKSPAFTWEEVEPLILSLLEQFCSELPAETTQGDG